MRVLFVNRCLSTRSGTETYVRDIAIELLRRMHQPTVFSPQLGEFADQLRSEGIRVVDRLADVDQQPDIIHGHHSWETMAATSHFPTTPAIFVGHDATAWHDTPPRLPQIRLYVAVDFGVRERFTKWNGIPEDKVCVVPNGIDLSSFRSRPSLPRRPRRALQLSSYSGPREQAEIKAACGARGIQLDSVGHNFANATAHLGDLLRDYDIVFAKGRCALEAMATGAAVVFCDTWGCGPMITSRFLRDGHGILAGRRILSQTFQRDVLLRQIDRYHPKDAARVSQEIRTIFDSRRVVDCLLKIYQDVINDYEPSEPLATTQAMSAELTWWSVYWEALLRDHLEATARLHPSLGTKCAEPSACDTSVCFDRPFRGGGWYPPEQDERGAFCWMGPEPWAWVELEMPEAEQSQLRIEIAHSLEPSFVKGLEVRVDGHRLRMKRRRRNGTLELSGTMPATTGPRVHRVVHILFSIPSTARPSDRDPSSKDNRHLGVAIRRILVEPTQNDGVLRRALRSLSKTRSSSAPAPRTSGQERAA